MNLDILSAVAPPGLALSLYIVLRIIMTHFCSFVVSALAALGGWVFWMAFRGPVCCLIRKTIPFVNGEEEEEDGCVLFA